MPIRAIGAVLFVLGGLLFIQAADADFPLQMSYQARLVDADGRPLEGNFDLTFSLCAHQTDGLRLWTETQNVNVVDGILDVLLGVDRPLNDTAFDAPEVWMEVHVPATGFTFNRVRVTATSYAFRVQSLEGSRGGTVSGASTFEGVVTMSGPSVNVEGELNLPDGIQLVSNLGTLSIISGQSTITIAPGGAITIQGDSDLSIAAGGNLSLEGTYVDISATANLTLEAGVDARLSGGATTYVLGSLVEIN